MPVSARRAPVLFPAMGNRWPSCQRFRPVGCASAMFLPSEWPSTWRSLRMTRGQPSMVRVLGVYARGRHHYFRELIQVDCRPGAPYRTGRNGTDHLTDVTSTRRFARRKKRLQRRLSFEPTAQSNRTPSRQVLQSGTLFADMRGHGCAASQAEWWTWSMPVKRWKAHAVSSSQEKKRKRRGRGDRRHALWLDLAARPVGREAWGQVALRAGNSRVPAAQAAPPQPFFAVSESASSRGGYY
ncbi:hypothetical protein K456DRAFT_1445346 [Colletotrichum gloeosporioides 23]|nr:hypothetical protein K456DRAFT_1445346 [Colletotrichum gloeosporioides 23]